MATSAAEIRNRADDAVRQVGQVAHEARRLKTLASDAVEDGVHAAKRAVTHGLHDLEDLRDSAAHRIKRAPLLTVGLAFGVGIALGQEFAHNFLGLRLAPPVCCPDVSPHCEKLLSGRMSFHVSG